MSCTQAKACGYHQNGITTQSHGGEGRVRGLNEYKINLVSGIKPKQSEFWDEGIKRICKRLRIL